MKGKKCKLVFYTCYSTVIDELFFNSVKQAMEEVKKRRGNMHYYCYTIYDIESCGIIKHGK